MNRWAVLYILLSCLAWKALPAAEGPKPIPIASVNASHDLPPKYAAAKAADGDEKTHWAASNSPPQWIRIQFADPAEVDTLRTLGVSAQNIYDNWRRVSVSFSDGSVFTVTLANQWEWHTIAFPKRKAAWVKLTIESAYKRTHYIGCEEIEAYFTGHNKKEIEVNPKAGPAPASVSRETTETWEPSGSDRKLLARLCEKPSSRQAGDNGRPNLWVNGEDVERAKRNIRTRPWAFEYYRNTLHLADEWAARNGEEIRRLVPRKDAVFDKKALCPRCNQSLAANFERPHQAYCPECKIVFPNSEYPDDGQGWKNPKSGKMSYFVGLYNERAIYAFDDALRALADAYALTREEQFAGAASVLFDAIAEIYPTCDKGPKWYPGVGGRLNRPFYQTARTLIYYCDEYDLLYYSPEWEKPSVDPRYKTRRENVEENFLRNGGEYCYAQIRGASVKSLNNGYCDYLQGALAAGRVLGIQEYIDYALESELSIFNFIENTIDRDGQYFETAFMYSSHSLDLFSHHAEMLRYYRSPKFPQDINLYDHPKLKLAFLRSERDTDCAGHVPPLGDTGPDVSVISEEQRQGIGPLVYRRLEYLAARTGDPGERAKYAEALRAYVGDVEKARGQYGLARWLTFNAAEIPEAPPDRHAIPPPVSNTLLPGSRGIGILRTGHGGDTAALLRWGPTLNHGSPDEMNLNFFALGREITYDPGYLWAHTRQGWAHATGSHNLVVVNEKNQLGQAGSGGDLELWFDAPGVRAMSANAPACYGSEDVSRYLRTLVLMDLSPTQHYLLDIFRVAGGHTHDLNWHFVGEMEPVRCPTLSPPQTTGSLAGPGCEWWKLVQPDGWLRGVNEGFHWSAPPGNGYGFIFNLQRTMADGPCAFDWKFGERQPAPRWLFRPGACVGETSGKLCEPLALGSYFYRAETPGDFIEFELPVEEKGDYLILAAFYKSSQYGIVQAALDGQPLGEPVNTYSPAGYFADPIALGRRHLVPGEHRLRFTAAGKDPESGGYCFSIQYFALETPDFLYSAQEPRPEMVRLHLLPAPDTEIIVGQAKSGGSFPDSTYVISRRKDETLSTQFASLVEPCIGDPDVASLERLRPATNARAEDIAALRIATRDGRIDYVFEATAPAEAAAYIHGEGDSAERVTFGGRFGVARTVKGKVTLLALHGPGVLEMGGHRFHSEDTEYRGFVNGVDMKGCAVYTAATLPEEGLQGSVIQFSNPAYSRRSPFLIRRIVREGERTRIELDTASLVMARGLVGDAKVEPGVIANLVPLDCERMVKRQFRTMYFQGKRMVGDDDRYWGQVKDVSIANWHVTSTEPMRPNSGERFSIVEVSPGDGFMILRTAYVKNPEG